MQAKRSVIIGASLGALIQLGMPAVSSAQQSADTKPAAKPHRTKTVKAAKKPDPQKEMAAQVQILREQVDALQRRLDTQTAAEQQTQATADKAAAQASAASAQAATAAAATQAIPVTVKTAVEEAKPKTDKIYYKGLAITLGGFLESAYVYRQHDQANDISTSFAATPYGNVPVGHTNETRFTGRQSRVSALVEGNVDPSTRLSMYTELDFQGGAQTANSNESNSYNPRLRHLFGAVDWEDMGLHLLAGQTWSLATLNNKGISSATTQTPPTIDGQYIPGFTWTRQPQIRLTENVGDLWFAASLENPQTTFYAGANAYPATVHLVYNTTAGQGFDTANTLSLNRVPDAVAKVAYDIPIADRPIHIEAFGLYRNFYDRLNYSNKTVSGGGFGAGLIVPVIPKYLDLQVSGLGGKGIGRYGSAQLTDVTFDQVGNIQPIHEIQALAGLTLHASKKLDFYVFAGEEKETQQSYVAIAAGKEVGYGYGSPLYVNSGCYTETSPGACVGNTRLIEQGVFGFWYKPYVGNYGRLQFGIEYEHTERKSMEGVGGSPVGVQNVGIASFRYYPY